MKNIEKNLSGLLQKLSESNDGTFSGGFTTISRNSNSLIIAGRGDPTNNCGTNCVTGCQKNNVPGCGGTINTFPGCGQ